MNEKKVRKPINTATLAWEGMAPEPLETMSKQFLRGDKGEKSRPTGLTPSAGLNLAVFQPAIRFKTPEDERELQWFFVANQGDTRIVEMGLSFRKG
jgi:hypothetical protein